MNPTQNAFLATLDFQLPAGFQQVLFATQESPLLEQAGGTTIYAAAELPQFNADYQADEFYPGFYLIGSTGGGEAYAIEKATGHFVRTPFIGHDDTAPELVGRTWAEFWAALNADDVDGA